MIDLKNEGLEVVAVIEIGDPDHETGVCDSLEIIPHDVEFLDGEKLCRHSEALAGYAVRDTRIAELEAENEALNIWRDLALQFDSHRMAALGHLKRLVADSQSKSCAELFLSEPPLAAHEVVAERDQLRAELADAKETITRYEVTAENCDVLRAELANQLEVKAFWIGRTRALEVELSAIKAQEPVSEVSEETFSSDGTSDVITHNLPIGTKLYAAPVAKQDNAAKMPCGAAVSNVYEAYEAGLVAKQVVMPERMDENPNQSAYNLGHAAGWNDHADTVARLNAADRLEAFIPRGDGYNSDYSNMLAEAVEVLRAKAAPAEVPYALRQWAMDDEPESTLFDEGYNAARRWVKMQLEKPAEPTEKILWYTGNTAEPTEAVEVVCITQGGCNVTWTATKELTPDGTELMTVAQHNRIVSALQASAMVVPDGYKVAAWCMTDFPANVTVSPEVCASWHRQLFNVSPLYLLAASPPAKGGE